MKRLFSAFSLFVLLGAGVRAGNKPRVAILEFKNKGLALRVVVVRRRARRAGHARDRAREERKVPGDRARAARGDHAGETPVLSGDIDPRTAVQIGKMLGVEYLIAGAVTEARRDGPGANVPGGSSRTAVRERPLAEGGGGARRPRVLDVHGRDRWADTARDETSDSSVYVAGAGGGASDHGKVDKLMRPVVVKLAASFAKADLKSSGMGGHGDASGLVGKIANVTAARCT